MKLARIVQQLHLWLGLLLAAQVILWMASGVVMSWFSIKEVRGETNAAADYAIELEARGYANPGGVIAQSDGATEVRLRTFLGKPVYDVTSAKGRTMFDAQSGDAISPIDAAAARAVALRDFVGDGEIETIELLDDPPHEYGRPGPVWRATFTDDLETRLYISPETGAVDARRNKIWRLYDFFWMLHIMDYKDRENFNNPLIRVAAATGFLFALTGAFMVVTRLRRGRYFGRLNREADGAAPAPVRSEHRGEQKSPLE